MPKDDVVQFNSPVEVNWSYMDTSLLQRFWAQHEEERAGLAPIADSILFFHRGITTVSPLCLEEDFVLLSSS
jgi:hypothetical protein